MRRQRGFTLTELLLVLAIIGIIALIAIPAFMDQRDTAYLREALKNAGKADAVVVVKIERNKDGSRVFAVQNRDRSLTIYTVTIKNQKPVLVQ